MLNKLVRFLNQYDMLRPGDRVICAVSGGADSVALLFALYLLREKLQIELHAAHFNHCLRGEESNRDARFVEALCNRLEIPLHMGAGQVIPGEKGLEAAARDARYGFLMSLPGKIATAHTADDNAETVLLHLIRGTGLKGLGGIPPVSGRLIRPMLTVTRQEVEQFLNEYHLRHVEDSTNGENAFLRNRVRHEVMPLLKKENPRIGENLSQLALMLRLDEAYLESQTGGELPPVSALRKLDPALRRRHLRRFLQESGVREPEQSHIALAESLIFSENPSARGAFPGGKIIVREYDRLTLAQEKTDILPRPLNCPGRTEIPEAGLAAVCIPAETLENDACCFTVVPQGQMILRSRQSGDTLRRLGGTKLLKKRMIDAKIPADVRGRIPVLCDETGILGVWSMGADLARIPKELPAVTVRFEKLQIRTAEENETQKYGGAEKW